MIVVTEKVDTWTPIFSEITSFLLTHVSVGDYHVADIMDFAQVHPPSRLRLSVGMRTATILQMWVSVTIYTAGCNVVPEGGTL